MVRHFAMAQTSKLRKNKPDPVALFTAAAEFGEHGIVYRILCLYETLKVEWIIQTIKSIALTPTEDCGACSTGCPRR